MIDTRPLWTIADICDVTNGQTHHGTADTTITGISIDNQADLTVEYPAAVITSANNPADASRFVDFLVSEQGRAILVRHGFGVP